jgi:hypothetical protein
MAAWEQEPDDLGGGPARLHIFSGTGVYVATIDFAQSWVDFDWSGSMLYALVRDRETDLVGLVAHRLVFPDQPQEAKAGRQGRRDRCASHKGAGLSADATAHNKTASAAGHL